MADYDQYLREHRNQHLETLFTFLRFPSISTLPEHADDVRRCAEFLADQLRQLGFEHVSLMETPGHPVVYADWLHAPGKPTVLVYGHYDVQPVDPLELWDTPPFEPTVRGNQLYARGSSDDKGQVFMHLKAFEALWKTTGSLPVNVKFCLEGEEEIGSRHLPALLEQHKDKFAADIVVISDTTMLGPNQPSVCYGLRGLTSLQIDVKGANTDLHSGLYGGGVQNAVHALVQLLASLHDPDGRVLVEGFYDEVVPLTADEREAFRALSFDEDRLAKELGVPELFGEAGFSYLERTWARPTLEINGVYGGFQGAGTKTVIPNEAHAKITCRLVPNQDPVRIQSLIEQHVLANCPPGVTVAVQRFDAGRPYVTPFHHPAIQWAAKAYEQAYGVPAAFTRMGGSIGVVETFDRVLKAPVVLMGFGLSDENFHAPNEHFSLDNFDKGLRVLCNYWLGLDAALQQG
ncbi:peptidase M20 [Alicyclobacillus contaminans]|uniref:dipeptidase n=1 Tax=Alicyclobacillus contaminans TaxID=392016 RepID=UPI00041EBABD|nr:dipeptidase [Alicyclobacillus contaminans]GMA51538.1 peptidase M20 [Alicyclobacillus contaminans]